jgi:hypothetical protein
MRIPLFPRLRRILLWVGLDLVLATALLGLSVWADSSAKLRQPPVQGCYCGCSASKTSAGCGKMCELPKFANRRWAVTCSKSRATTPAETPGAGPRVPHPSRSERASN